MIKEPEIYEGVQIWSNVEYGGKVCLGKEKFITLKDHESEIEALKHDIERYIELNSGLLEDDAYFRSAIYDYFVPIWQSGNDEQGMLAAKFLDALCQGKFDKPRG